MSRAPQRSASYHKSPPSAFSRQVIASNIPTPRRHLVPCDVLMLRRTRLGVSPNLSRVRLVRRIAPPTARGSCRLNATMMSRPTTPSVPALSTSRNNFSVEEMPSFSLLSRTAVLPFLGGRPRARRVVDGRSDKVGLCPFDANRTNSIASLAESHVISTPSIFTLKGMMHKSMRHAWRISIPCAKNFW